MKREIEREDISKIQYRVKGRRNQVSPTIFFRVFDPQLSLHKKYQGLRLFSTISMDVETIDHSQMKDQ